MVFSCSSGECCRVFVEPRRRFFRCFLCLQLKRKYSFCKLSYFAAETLYLQHSCCCFFFVWFVQLQIISIFPLSQKHLVRRLASGCFIKYKYILSTFQLVASC